MELTEKNFEEVLKSNENVVVDFWATWCGPCRTLSKTIEELEKEYEGKVVVGKVDIEENDDITVKYNIRNVPTVMFFKNGELIDKQVGASAKCIYKEKIDRMIG